MISGQGDSDAELVAGRTSEELVDILLNEFGLNSIPLQNLDIDSCRMGTVENYRNLLKNQLNNFQTITTYTQLCSVLSHKHCRIWIEEKDKEYFFYEESEISQKGIRIIEYTDFYRSLLKKEWEPNPNNPDEIDISDCMDFSY